MVSRKHAKLSTHDEQLIIQDLGSTNGTFVNGEKIKRVRLREGDRILIGTSIVKLVTLDPAVGLDGLATPTTDFPPGSEPQAQPMQGKRTSAGTRSMAGTIDEIPLPDLLQLLSTSRKSGVLEIQTQGNVGRIYLREGQIYYASINESTTVPARKAVYRMLVWESGTFELQPPEDQKFEDELHEPTEGLLMEAMRQLDEIRRLHQDLPPLEATLELAKPLDEPLRNLPPEKLDLVQLVHNIGRLGEVVDRSQTTDLETYTDLLELLKANIIVAAEASEAAERAAS
jgi:hypothetical protein